MPSWGDVLQEIQAEIELFKTNPPAGHPQGFGPLDAVRERHLAALHSHTKRAVIVYASDWMGNSPPHTTQVELRDIQGFMETIHGVSEDELDLILHLPGGSAEAADAIVKYLRKKFTHIRVFVPHAAMSAATMLACSADEIVMGAHSFLGPIDPQIVFRNGESGGNMVPAQAILDQFRLAQSECVDPKKLASWLPILKTYGPGLLVQCRHHQKLAEELVATWLTTYMLKGKPNGAALGKTAAASLADHKTFKSHGRVIDRGQARSFGLHVTDLEADQVLQDLVLTVYHAFSHTLTGSSASKIIENHARKRYVMHHRRPPPIAAQPPVAPAPPPSIPAGPPRARKPKPRRKRGR